MGWLTLPHQISLVTEGSSTTNLSCTERPVCTPVWTMKAPSTEKRPSRRRIASATRAGAVWLAWTGWDACTPVPDKAAAARCFQFVSCVKVGVLPSSHCKSAHAYRATSVSGEAGAAKIRFWRDRDGIRQAGGEARWHGHEGRSMSTVHL